MIRALRAYPTLLRVGLAGAVAYRAEMIVWMLTSTMPLVSLALWSAAAETGPIGGYTQARFSSYFLATLIVRQVTGSWLVWVMNMEIRDGTLSRRLLVPIHPLFTYSAENLAALPLRAIVVAPVAVVWIVFLEDGELPMHAAEVALVPLALLGAWLINFFTMALIGSLAFFLESSTAVFDLWLVAFMLLSGYLVPLDLFPPALEPITRALPFRYGVAFPVELVTGVLRGEAALEQLAHQWAWVLGVGSAAVALFQSGVRRFAAYGG